MKDFDIAKYLRENHLGSHAILGNYVDLHALKEESQLNEASLELDWASGIDSLKAKCKKHGLTCKVVKEFGPGGGNPLVKIIGSKDNIISWLEDGYADADQLEDFVADIKENLEEEEVGNNKPVDEVPYVGAEEKLDGFGDEFDQIAPVEEAMSAWEEKLNYYESEVNDLVYDMMDTTGADADQIADFFQYISTQVRNHGNY